MTKALPSISTINEMAESWDQQMPEIARLGLQEIGLFLTGLRTTEERSACYSLLEEVQRDFPFEIPVIHAVSDMAEEEFWYLQDQFQTRSFNIHPLRQYPLSVRLSPDIREHIFIENSFYLYEDDLAGFAGICLDLSHLETLRLLDDPAYRVIDELAREYPVGFNHLSAVATDTIEDPEIGENYSRHYAEGISQYDYIERYDIEYFGDYAAIELCNTLEEQLPIRDRIEAHLQKIGSGATW